MQQERQTRMPNRKNKLDKILASTNATVLLAFLFIFQVNQISPIIKWTLLISFTLYIISLLLLLWNIHRFPIRMKLLDELREKTVKKYSARIASFIEEIAVPFSRLKAKDEVLSRLANVKTKEEHEKLMESINKEIKQLESGEINMPHSEGEEKATHYVVESFVEQLGHASQGDFQKAFRRPLREKYPRIKYRIDRFALRSRLHIFASASVFLLFTILIGIVSK
jgi:hypothetical protein